MATQEKTVYERYSHTPKPKRVSKHKHVAPQKALQNHRQGSVKVEFIEDKKKRSNTLCDRKSTLFKKAYELWKMTGAEITVVINGEEWCSEFPLGRHLSEHQAEREHAPTPDAASVPWYISEQTTVSQTTFHVQHIEVVTEEHVPECIPHTQSADKEMVLSPRAVRKRHKISEESTPVEQVPETPSENTNGKWEPLQPSSDSVDSDRECRICASHYSVDSKKIQELWMGCDDEACKFWIHSKCLLGKWPTKSILIGKLPFVCPKHRK